MTQTLEELKIGLRNERPTIFNPLEKSVPGQSMRLKQLSIQNIQEIWEFVNQHKPELAEAGFGAEIYESQEELEAWINGLDWTQALEFMVISGNKPVGMMALEPSEPGSKNAKLLWCFKPTFTEDATEKEAMTAAVLALMGHAQKIGLRGIMARVDTGDTRRTDVLIAADFQIVQHRSDQWQTYERII